LAGLVDFREVAYIPNGFCGGGEARAIGSQVREDSGHGFISHPRDGEEIFSREGVFRSLGCEKLFDLFFELFDGGREVLDMAQEDAQGGGSGFFCSAGVDGGLRSFDEGFDLLETQLFPGMARTIFSICLGLACARSLAVGNFWRIAVEAVAKGF
jgi:hypothetical protein